mgnify:CR=1 FL=1
MKHGNRRETVWMRRSGLGGAVERHRDMVFRLAYTYLRDPADADDVTQDVFVKLCSAAASGLRAMSI